MGRRPPGQCICTIAAAPWRSGGEAHGAIGAERRVHLGGEAAGGIPPCRRVQLGLCVGGVALEGPAWSAGG
jgi:hypothetical protein